AMLGLGEQVERDRPGVRVRVGDHEQIAGTGEAVDPHPPGQLALGLLNVEVPGADDHVYRGDRHGPESECRDRLRAAHAVDRRRPPRTAGPSRASACARSSAVTVRGGGAALRVSCRAVSSASARSPPWATASMISLTVPATFEPEATERRSRAAAAGASAPTA